MTRKPRTPDPNPSPKYQGTSPPTSGSNKSQPRVGRYLIYGLIDPRDRSLRYIGKTHKRRELRLAEHMLHALEGNIAPVYAWIRSLLGEGLDPEVFVLERIEPGGDWRRAEQEAITRWRNWPLDGLPYTHPPQTPKSQPVIIAAVRLANVRPGG